MKYMLMAALVVSLLTLACSSGETPGAARVGSPTPTANSTPAWSTAEETYKQAMLLEATAMTNSLTKFSDLMNKVQADPALLFDQKWKTDVVAQLGSWLVSEQHVKGLSPPPAFASAHFKYQSAMALYALAATDMVIGIGDFDAAHIDAANEKMVRANALFAEATSLLPVPEVESEGGRPDGGDAAE